MTDHLQQQIARIEMRSIPKDQRVHVIIHEVIPETQSFITSSGLVSFIPDGADELSKIEEMDEKIRQNYDRILEAPPMLHVRAGNSVLAFYQVTWKIGRKYSTVPRARVRTNERVKRAVWSERNEQYGASK